jgi:hypothetical protein
VGALDHTEVTPLDLRSPGVGSASAASYTNTHLDLTVGEVEPAGLWDSL